MSPYDYRVTSVARVVDGDTVDLVLDLGFGLSRLGRFRLTIVDTPERGEPRWQEATDATIAWLTEGWDGLRVTTYKSDSFGRWLGDVYRPDGDSLTGHLLLLGFATYRR